MSSGVKPRWPESVVKDVVAMMNALFPPGTPVSTAGFLGGVTRLLQAGRATLLLARLDHAKDSLQILDAVLYNADTALEARFDNDIHDRPRWDADPISARVRRRLTRRPKAVFTYSARNWLRSMDGQQSFARDVLDSIDAQYDLSSVLPFDNGYHCLLNVFRRKDQVKPFTPLDRRVLTIIHTTLSERLVEMRDSKLRSRIPEAVRGTFALILAGHSEKEVAKLTHRSPNTVHDHVKRIYQHFEVTSRAQLLSRFVDLTRLKDELL